MKKGFCIRGTFPRLSIMLACFLLSQTGERVMCRFCCQNDRAACTGISHGSTQC